MKQALTLFFLTLILATSAQAQESSIWDANPDYTLAKLASLEKPATSFTFDFSACANSYGGSAEALCEGREGGFIFAQDLGGFFNIVKVHGADQQVILERTSQPVLNLGYHRGILYAVTRGRINTVTKGKIKELINGLPVHGDYGNGPLVFSGEQMYFSVGTATNSGVVGQDNAWLHKYPSMHDLPCQDLRLHTLPIETENFLTAKKKDKALTSAFSPFNTPSKNQQVRGALKCSGAIFHSALDGSGMQVLAWGLHNIKSLSVGDDGSVYALDGGMEDRGVRPVKNGRDGFYKITSAWYGWPDYHASEKISNENLIAHTPKPPLPQAVYELNKLKSLLVVPALFGGFSVGATLDNSLVVAKTDSSLEQIGKLKPGFEIRQIKFGPEDKLYVLVSNGQSSELYSIEPTHKPIQLGASISRRVSGPWTFSLTLLLSGLAVVYTSWKRQRVV